MAAPIGYSNCFSSFSNNLFSKKTIGNMTMPAAMPTTDTQHSVVRFQFVIDGDTNLASFLY